MQAKALWITAKNKAEIRNLNLNSVNVKQDLLTMLTSGISRGTESVVSKGLLPAPDREFMRCPNMEGDFPYPVKYGYCAVARLETGENKGKNVFCLHPHQTQFYSDNYTGLPDALPIARATLTANMETALNAIWDGGATAGQKIVIVGAGIVGLLIGYLASKIIGTEVWLIDINQNRREIANKMGCHFQKPLDAPFDADLVFHTSATSAGLACALACSGQEAKVIEVSWYGDQDPSVPLGAGFHPKRLQLIGTQVGQIAPLMRPRWDYRKRLEKAISLLNDPVLDLLLTHEIAFDNLESDYIKTLQDPEVLMARITY